MTIKFWRIDLAKNVFQPCGLNQAGKPVYSKRVSRKVLIQTDSLQCVPAVPVGAPAAVPDNGV